MRNVKLGFRLASVVALAGLLGVVEPSRSKAAGGPHTEMRPARIPPSSRKPTATHDRRRARLSPSKKSSRALRAEEEKYRDLEYSLRITTRKV